MAHTFKPVPCLHLAAYYEHRWHGQHCIGFNLLRWGYREWADGRVYSMLSNNLYTPDLQAELAAWYVETIGYDPFEDDPRITVAEVQDLKDGYLAERAAAEREHEMEYVE